ncbi:hypothetical protein Tco_0561667 [Tanacetum coccineum]
MRFIPKHETVQKYSAILLDTLTNQAMKELDAYKTYHDFAIGKLIPKPKYVRRLTREKTDQAPTASPGKRLKATTKVAKSRKKKQPAQCLETLSEIALSEAEQMKIVTKRSKTQFHSSHASGSGANEGTGVSPGVPDVPTYRSEDEQISWKSSDEDDDDEVSLSKDDDDNANNEDDDGQDDDNEQTESDNDGEDFVHPKFSTHEEEEREKEEYKEEEGSDLRVQTPSHFESTDDEVTQGDNVEGEELNEEETNKEEEVNKLYRDVNVNLERRDTKMTDAPQTNVQGFISNILNPKLDTCIDSILNLNTESTSLVDVPVTTNVEIPPSSQTNLFAEAVSSIFGIVDKYLANQMNEAVKAVVQLQSDRLRSEAQADNEDFINKIDENMKKIIKEQVKMQVKEQTSYAVAANLSELELKKILIDEMEKNKSIDRSVQQKTLYKALTTQHPDWFQKPTKPPTPDRDWNKTLPAKHGPVQPWISTLARNKDPHELFNELVDTSLDFSAFMLNRLKVDTLTLKLLAGPTFELMKGSCKSLVELEYFLEEVCKATTDQLDWNNPEGQQYPHDLRKPLPLILNSRGR